MKPWLWQNVADWWTLVHCWGFAVADWGALQIWPGTLMMATRDRVRLVPMRRVLFWLAVLAGVLWEVCEWLWVEPWLHFHEPIGNRLFDIFADGFGAWFGLRLAREQPPRILKEGP